MLHKHFKRARRFWNRIHGEDPEAQDASIYAEWALEFAEPLIKEVERLRTELKHSNKKRRGVYASLHVEEDEFDRMIGKIEDVIGGLPADPRESVASYFVTEQLGAILSEFKDDGDD